MRTRFSAFLVLLGAFAIFAGTASTAGPKFYRDDPISREPESQDASQAQESEIGQLFEMTKNLFVTSEYKPTGLRAQNINTIDEVPDSSWFTNRIGTKQMTTEELLKGPLVGAPPDPSRWTIIREKIAGAHPGVTARDAKGETWFLEFDPSYFAQGATGAVMIATKIFYALGYNQVESFLTTFDPKNVEFDPKATVKRPNGKRTPFTRDDIDAILERVAKNPDGSYRVIAGRLLPGKILGNFRYEGTRPDDPNDVVPHEHRRELRALRVFGAWTNLTDLKSANTIDTLITENGKSLVKHYLQDVGSTFGMNNDKYEWDLGYEHFYQGDTTLKRLLSFGFALSPWQTANYTEYPSVGKIEGDVFDPRKWRPQTPTTAYMEMRDDDAFWAARKVGAFTDDMIRAMVHTGEFSDQAAEKYLADMIIKRRDKILSTYLPAVTPIASPRLEGNQLTFENAAVASGVAQAPAAYRAAWMQFDNATAQTRPISETTGTGTTIQAPSGLPSGADSYVAVDISADSKEHPAWQRPARAYFRRDGNGWKLVGLEHLPESLTPAEAPGKKGTK
jgi:hypothetical protein